MLTRLLTSKCLCLREALRWKKRLYAVLLATSYGNTITDMHDQTGSGSSFRVRQLWSQIEVILFFAVAPSLIRTSARKVEHLSASTNRMLTHFRHHRDHLHPHYPSSAFPPFFYKTFPGYDEAQRAMAQTSPPRKPSTQWVHVAGHARADVAATPTTATATPDAGDSGDSRDHAPDRSPPPKRRREDKERTRVSRACDRCKR